jgi:hypothetical protein
MRRMTIHLSDELHEQLRRDALRAKVSMAELIRSELRESRGPRRKIAASEDPILKVAGKCLRAILSQGVDESLYGD